MEEGQGLSMNVILIAILATLVFVIFAVIYTGQVGIGSQNNDLELKPIYSPPQEILISDCETISNNEKKCTVSTLPAD